MKWPLSRRFWISLLAAVVVGTAFLLAWKLTHPALPRGTLVVPRDAPTVSEALRRVSPGGVIALDAERGPFSEPIRIDVPRITLRSRGRPATLLGGESPAIDVVADEVTVEGLHVRGGECGIAVAGSGCRVRNVSLESCDVGVRFSQGEASLAQGIRITDGRIGVEAAASALTLRDIECMSQSDAGIRLQGAVHADVENALVDGALIGLSAEACVEAHIVRARVENCSQAGIEILAGRDNAAGASSVHNTPIGILLRGTQSATVETCRVTECEDAAIEVVGAQGCRVSAVDARWCDTGARVRGGSNNAVLDGKFRDCRVSVGVVESRNVLVGRNVVSGGEIAISLDRSADAQITHNEVTRALTCGVFLDSSEAALVLDNVVQKSGAGVVAQSSDGSLFQRNEIRNNLTAGLTLTRGVAGSHVAQNRMEGQPVGVLVSESSRDLVSENEILACETGVLLHGVGHGVRAWGNRFTRDAVGLSWDDGAVSFEPLRRLGLSLERVLSEGTPTVTGNEFRASRTYDLAAATGSTLDAGGNLFYDTRGAAAGRVAGDVRLPRSAWKGTLVVGAGSSPTSRVLAQLLALYFSGEGYRVVDLAGFASEGELVRALARGDVDVAWCLGDPRPHVSLETPARAGWVLVARPERVSTRSESPVAVTVCASPGAPEAEVREALEREGLAVASYVEAGSGQAAETALQMGSADIAVVDGIEETLTLGGYSLLGNGGLLSPATVRLAVAPSCAEEVRESFLRLAPRMTSAALRQLVSRVRLLHQDARDVALDFLAHNLASAE